MSTKMYEVLHPLLLPLAWTATLFDFNWLILWFSLWNRFSERGSYVVLFFHQYVEKEYIDICTKVIYCAAHANNIGNYTGIYYLIYVLRDLIQSPKKNKSQIMTRCQFLFLILFLKKVFQIHHHCHYFHLLVSRF